MLPYSSDEGARRHAPGPSLDRGHGDRRAVPQAGTDAFRLDHTRPLRYGTIEDLEKVLLDWYPRWRALHLKYTPRRQMLEKSDPNYAELIKEDAAIDAWATAELERLYGAPLDRELRGWAWNLVGGYASRVK